MSYCKILLADDHPLLRKGLCQAIVETTKFKVIAEVSDGQAALEKTQELKPHVVVLDIDMPILDGFSVAKILLAEEPAIKIIFLTVHREESFLNKALKIGAHGYILKDSAPVDIVMAISNVFNGEFFISESMSTYLLNRNIDTGDAQGLARLTSTERAIMKLIAEYKTTKEIAAIVSISPRTVETHRANMCQKLRLQGSHALMKFAVSHLDELL